MAADTLSALDKGYVDLGGLDKPTGSARFDLSQGPDYRKRSPEVEEQGLAYVEKVRERKPQDAGP